MEKVNKNTRSYNTIRNTAFGFIGQLVLLILSFMSRTVFIQTLGEDYLGINGLFSSIISLLALSELGVGNVMLFLLYKPVSEQNTNKIICYLNYFKKIYNYIAVLLLLIGLIIILVLPYIVVSPLKLSSLIIYYILFLLNSVASYIFIYKSILIDALQKKYIITSITIIANVLKNIIQILVLYILHSFSVYLIIQIIATLLTNVIISLIANKIFIKNKTSKLIITKSEKQMIFAKIKSTFVYKIGTLLINNSENIIISIVINTAMVGLYSNYVLIITSVTTFISIVNASVFSSIGNLIAESNKEKIEKIFYSFIYLYQFLMTMLSIGMFLCFNIFIDIWIGEKYILEFSTVGLICLKFYIGNISNPLWMFREASGLFEKVKYIMVIASVLNIILSIFFGDVLGLQGILLGGIIARLITIFWYEPALLHANIFNSAVKKYWKTQIKYIIYSLIILLCSSILLFLCPKNFFGIILICMIVPINTIFIYAFINRKDKNFQYLFNKFLNNKKSI